MQPSSASTGPSTSEKDLIELEPGAELCGRYHVERRLGSGGGGVVYRARDLALERTVALKFQSAREGELDRDALRREAAALATLRHANVSAVHSFERHEGVPFFVMEHVSGRSLDALVHEHYDVRHSPVPLHRGLQVLHQLCDGLSAVHGAGLVHRDVKTENVIIEDRTGRVVLVDFGAAVVPSAWDGDIVGTLEYMAPETHLGARPTPASDLYALACLAFELMTGQLPFEGEAGALRRAHLHEAPPRISQRRAEMASLDELMARLLGKQPAQRPASAALVRRALEDVMRRSADAGLPPPSPNAATAPAAAPARPSLAPAALASGPEAYRAGLRVLVVDDDLTFGRVAARAAELALADLEVSVTRVGSGRDALEAARRARPDPIVLDYLLPDANGVDVLSRIRQVDGPQPEVLVASGALAASQRWRFDILGVCDFVDKPVEIPELVSALQRLATRRGWLRPVGVAR